MKAIMIASIYLALTVLAAAKPIPVDNSSLWAGQTSMPARNNATVNIGPASNSPERSYFQAPQPQFNAGGLSCRMPPSVFDKTRLAQSCN